MACLQGESMIRAELTAILCSDAPNGDFSAYHPDNPTSFSCSLQLLVGIHNQGRGESFQLTLCTPQWLAETHAPEDIVVGKNLLIVFDYNYLHIVQWLNRYVERCTGETWEDIVKRVSALGSWEFENYQSHPE
jgi:hypothetical protein